MNQRLLKALERGGMIVQLRSDQWGVRRRRDRRSRVIGTMNGADVDVLRLKGQLKPLGTDLPATLVWRGQFCVAWCSGAAASGADVQSAVNVFAGPFASDSAVGCHS